LDIRNTKAYKEYYACATGEATPKPKESVRRKRGSSDSSTTPQTPIATPTPITTIVAAPRLTAATKGKQPARATSTTNPSDVERTEAEQLKIVLRRSRQETHISQQDVDAQDTDRDDDEGKKNHESDDGKDDDDDNNDDEEEIAKIDEPNDTESGGDDEETKSDGESEEEGTMVEEEETDLSEMELKKILIDKMEGNKSIHRLDKQQCLYRALFEAYEADKTILDSYGESAIPKRRQEPVQTTCQMEEPSHSVFETGAEDQPIVQTSQHPEWFSQPRKPPTPDTDWNKTLPAPLPLIPDNRGRRVIPFKHFINNDLEYLQGGTSSRKYTTSVTKTKAADYGHIKWIEDLVPRTMWIQEPINYDKHAFWGVSHQGENVSSSTEDDFKRLRLQDIEDMLLLLVQGKMSNLTVDERFAFNVSLRMFTRSIVIQRRVEDLQLGVKSYRKRLNLTKPDTYRSDLKRREAYTAYSNLRGFIYQNKDKKNRKGDKDRAAAMIQAIDKMLKTRRIIRSLERFVGGRQYEGDFRMLQRTI
nr:hypothetical protein [Tanacetum cinerariifolium]